jgi:hypothetical protein
VRLSISRSYSYRIPDQIKSNQIKSKTPDWINMIPFPSRGLPPTHHPVIPPQGEWKAKSSKLLIILRFSSAGPPASFRGHCCGGNSFFFLLQSSGSRYIAFKELVKKGLNVALIRSRPNSRRKIKFLTSPYKNSLVSAWHVTRPHDPP